jgi:hypothetical protein
LAVKLFSRRSWEYLPPGVAGMRKAEETAALIRMKKVKKNTFKKK